MAFTLSVKSKLAAAPMEVWHRVNTLAGVNAELMPLLRMTAPANSYQLPFTQAARQQPLFASWLLLFGILPFDRHQLQLDEVWEGGFRENSSSLIHRYWRHERIITPDNGGAVLSDTLEFEPRLSSLGYLLLPLVRMIFTHRHHYLRQQFGTFSAQPR